MTKIVIRKCAVCKKESDRIDLIKITKLENGLLKINPTSKEIGRSVYICKNPDCIKLFIKKKRLKGGLKYSNPLETERVEKELLKMITNMEKEVK